MSKEYNELCEKVKKDFELIKRGQLACGKDYGFRKVAICFEAMSWLLERPEDEVDEDLIKILNKSDRPLSLWYLEAWQAIDSHLFEDFERATYGFVERAKKSEKGLDNASNL